MRDTNPNLPSLLRVIDAVKPDPSYAITRWQALKKLVAIWLARSVWKRRILAIAIGLLICGCAPRQRPTSFPTAAPRMAVVSIADVVPTETGWECRKLSPETVSALSDYQFIQGPSVIVWHTTNGGHWRVIASDGAGWREVAWIYDWQAGVHNLTLPIPTNRSFRLVSP